VDARFLEGRQVADLGSLEADQAGDGLGRGHFGQYLDFLGSSTEAGALEQVRGEVVVPVRGTDGGQVVLPRGGAGLLGERWKRRGKNERPKEANSSEHGQTPSDVRAEEDFTTK
jgi:hypothetical protein